jgi:hypothetical protein
MPSRSAARRRYTIAATMDLEGLDSIPIAHPRGGA